MITIKRFIFNPFQENTYLLYDETNECLIVDPGCYEDFEKQEFSGFIAQNKLKPVKLVNTHSHIDHILGNNFIINKYNIGLEIHREGKEFHNASKDHGLAFGMIIDKPIEPSGFLEDNSIINFGNSTLEVLYTPGHVDGHICLLSHEQKFVIVGDVLFQMSIGRTDLPTGDYDLLMNSIRDQLMVLPDDYIVYPGHGHETTIGYERMNNPFLNQ